MGFEPHSAITGLPNVVAWVESDVAEWIATSRTVTTVAGPSSGVPVNTDNLSARIGTAQAIVRFCGTAQCVLDAHTVAFQGADSKQMDSNPDRRASHLSL